MPCRVRGPPAGRIALTTIYVPPGLSAPDRRRAHRAGPRAVASRADQAQLLASAGFIDIEEVDLTEEFAATSRAWIEEWDLHADDLVALEGQAAFDDRQHGRRLQQRAIDDRLLRRGMFTATRSI